MSHGSDEFIVLRVRAFTMMVCTSLPIEEAVKRANESHPTGASAPWARVEDRISDACIKSPNSHKHITFEC